MVMVSSYLSHIFKNLGDRINKHLQLTDKLSTVNINSFLSASQPISHQGYMNIYSVYAEQHPYFYTIIAYI